jgi:hypothetical protein
MDYITDILTFIKGYNGTWSQCFVAGLYLNFRLICSFIIFLIFFNQIRVTKKVTKFQIFLLIIVSSFITSDITDFNERRKLETIQHPQDYFNKNTKNLVIVVEGSLGPFKDVSGANEVQIDISKSRDLDGLGLVESKVETKETSVITYIGTNNYNLTSEEVFKTVKYFRLFNPTGKVVLIGHSIGGYNVAQVLDNLNKEKIGVDLVVFLDSANQLYNNYDYQIKDNVGYVINFMSVKWSDNMIFFTNSGGRVSLFKDNRITKVLNVDIPNTTHTSIDNTVHKYVISIVNNFLEKKSNPIDFVKQYKFKP